jgi:CDP-6-deoxy-D-xylo-4-hexulose-3-dehydrase
MPGKTRKPEEIKQDIFALVKEYQKSSAAECTFVPGETVIPFARRVYDDKELISLVDSSLDFWLTAGKYASEFEKKFADLLGLKHCLLVNSGSSANLLAMTALTSPLLGEKRLKPGDEVITVAAAFPTTVNPIIQNRLIPVFVDIDLGTYNIKTEQMEKALSKKTKAVFLAHTLANPFDLEAVTKFAKENNLFLIEDCCDAVGSTFNGQAVGTFGDLATVSFYPAHHMTMGEGGAVLTNSGNMARIVRSFRDWGRDCYCEPGHDNTCGKRFSQQHGTLPFGYDHKYVYSHIGYNLKITDLQAAIGVEQLEKLPRFIETRKRNFATLYKRLKRHRQYLILPETHPKAIPSWFAFPLTVKRNASFTAKELVSFLENRKIMTRKLFAGNITRQPAYQNVPYRVAGDLSNTDYVMENTFFIGVYPGLTPEMLDYVIRSFDDFFRDIPCQTGRLSE